MNCADAELLIHALIDGELDAGNAREVEAHAAGCPTCGPELEAFRAMRVAMAGLDLKQAATPLLRDRIEAALPSPPARLASSRQVSPPSRRAFFGGFAAGAALAAAAAASLAVVVIGDRQEQTVANEVVSAHIRSLQPGHLTDVETSDQHTVKPWFNGRLDVAPPVVDLTAEGFTLIGGRLDYVDGEPVAVIVYRRRQHIINLFVSHRSGARTGSATTATVQGYHARHWSEQGLDLWAVSDVAADDLGEFARRISEALNPASRRS
jgi:anti-sigma factor RsiW